MSLRLELSKGTLENNRKTKCRNVKGERERLAQCQRSQCDVAEGRRSSPTGFYTPADANEERKQEESQRQEEIAKGWRNSLGAWRGEMFGEVPGVPVGTVFGSGDYQRRGRFEMSRTGFFKPFVTPEWIDNATKEVYAVVVNNDNGLSWTKVM